MNIRQRLRTIFTDAHEQASILIAIDRVESRIHSIGNAVLELGMGKPDEGAFVCVHVVADVEREPFLAPYKHDGLAREVSRRVERITLGASKRIRGLSDLVLKPHFPLTNVSVTVFADLERVQVSQIVLGVDVLTAAIGVCPSAQFASWPMGIDLRVICEADNWVGRVRAVRA